MKDAMKSLKSMPNLLSLVLVSNACEDKILHFQDGSFQNLKELTLVSLKSLNYILIDKDALPSLKKLHLVWIPKLEAVPNSIQHIKKLEVLYMEFMSIAPQEGKKHWIFKHATLTEICIGFAKSNTRGWMN